MDEQRKRDLPIDRGWAWVITFASCGLFGYVSGGFKSQGVILVELQEIFPDASAQSVLWIFSLTMLVNRFTGPVNGFILSRTSNRFICCLGVCLMTTSLAVFGYLPKIAYMYPVYGGIYGWGSGMLTLSAFTAYGPYFDKKKALSVGISSSGSGIGTILIPVLLRALFDNYSFSGAMLIYAGTAFQMLVLAFLLRPISFYERIAERRRVAYSKDTDIEAPSLVSKLDNKLYNDDPASDQDNSKAPAMTPNQLVAHDLRHKDKPRPLSTGHENTLSISRSELAYSMHDISSAISVYREVDESREEENDTDVKPKRLPFNWRLIHNPRCIMLGFAMICYMSGLAVTYYSIPPLGKSSGVNKQLVAILFVVFGLLEIPCRTGNGWIADKRFVSTYTHLTTCMLITGICACLCGFISGIAGLVIVMTGLSSVGTSVLSLLPITAGEMFGQENASGVMSIMFVYLGMASIISTFSAGAIVEAFGKWEFVFIYIGACMILGFLTMVLSAVTFHLIDKRRQASKTLTNKKELQ